MGGCHGDPDDRSGSSGLRRTAPPDRRVVGREARQLLFSSRHPGRCMRNRPPRPSSTDDRWRSAALSQTCSSRRSSFSVCRALWKLVELLCCVSHASLLLLSRGSISAPPLPIKLYTCVSSESTRSRKGRTVQAAPHSTAGVCVRGTRTHPDPHNQPHIGTSQSNTSAITPPCSHGPTGGGGLCRQAITMACSETCAQAPLRTQPHGLNLHHRGL